MGLRWAGLTLRAGSALGLLVIATVAANAGGFAIREQSAYGQGASFAGIAAGGALSSMFWNPATITQFKGKQYETSVSTILPHASHSFSSATLGAFDNAPSNSGDYAVVPASYSSYQLNDRLWIGMSTNAPFGLGVNFPQLWAGAAYGQSAKVETYNFSPTVAYKINDWISVGAGLQVEYMKVSYGAFLGLNGLSPLTGSVSGAGWSYGFTAGVTLTPLPKTQIGIGYRSALDQKINGTLELPPGTSFSAPISTPGSVNLTLNMPDMVTVGLRQGIGDRFTLLAGFEWSNWSRIGTSSLLQPNGAPALIGLNAVQFPFNYSDGYLYSLGGEYIVDPSLTLRAGIAYEKSPITDSVRTPRLPDDDRMWYSVGLSYRPPAFDGLVFDLAYSYIDVKDASLDLGPGTGNPWSGTTTYVGSVQSHINIISVGLRYYWDKMPFPNPAKH